MPRRSPRPRTCPTCGQVFGNIGGHYRWNPGHRPATRAGHIDRALRGLREERRVIDGAIRILERLAR